MVSVRLGSGRITLFDLLHEKRKTLSKISLQIVNSERKPKLELYFNPWLDQFMSSFISEWGPISTHFNTEILPPSRIYLDLNGFYHITYVTRQNNFCQNIGRFHISNGIYFSVDTFTGLIVQKCFDIDCRHFRQVVGSVPLWCCERWDHSVDQLDDIECRRLGV